MDAERDKYDWIEDFSIQITRRGILSLRSDPDLELYTGSKLLASLWLAVVAGMAGALGGIVVSGALWDSFLYPAVWLLVVAVVSIIVWQATRRLAGSAVAFLAGWCIFWGMLTGVMAGWGAQLGAAGWAYGIAGGMGFLIGITHGHALFLRYLLGGETLLFGSGGRLGSGKTDTGFATEVGTGVQFKIARHAVFGLMFGPSVPSALATVIQYTGRSRFSKCARSLNRSRSIERRKGCPTSSLPHPAGAGDTRASIRKSDVRTQDATCVMSM